ncbi:ABC transporter ATP-binding protein [Actinomadura logoneensis]|uniref:ABC transporter ATP-binding protein n=1 Tax=Actinomadura logoneensis TaxID=2293572 RepID=A0A372JF03_9ACTN|nr:ABC transporter ATP-binding protein [Actinomadura logoneensis]
MNTPSSPVLSGTGLVKRFGSTVALGGVDLAVGRAEAVAIMGPSGSGKSTLLHCLAGIMRPDEGEVRLLGDRIDDLGERRRSALRRTRFGFVFQFGQLLPELPADENVALPLMLGGTSRAEAVRSARAWFGPLGLAGMEGRRPGELSGGQAQRVAIARALASRPAVVFADEPTGALDQATGHETMRLLVEATRRNGASLVVVTHDPGVAAWCDRTVEVRDGRLLTGAPPAPPQPGPSPFPPSSQPDPSQFAPPSQPDPPQFPPPSQPYGAS